MLIPVEELVKQFDIKINGVLHLGAHQAEEAPAYQQANASRVVWIEGNPELMPFLETALRQYANQVAYNVLVADKDDQPVDFKVTNNFQSSSILEMGSHKNHHPAVTVNHILSLKTHRLDTFFERNAIDVSDCNFLNIDLQGTELMAMKGLGEHLNHFDYVYTEVNVGSVYLGCATLYEIDKFLHQKGFQRVAIKLTVWEWGDAIYIRNYPGMTQRLGNLFSAVYHQWLSFMIVHFNKSYGRTRRFLGRIKRKLYPKSVDLVDPNSNGERYFISTIIEGAKGKIVIFDVGANVGTYTKLVLDELKRQGKTDYEIHLFEPQNQCYQALCGEFENETAVRINNFALSDTEGECLIHYNYAGSSSASMYERPAISLAQSETIQVKTLADYIKSNKIQNITLLKIDTEGNEKKVLSGGENFIKPDLIGAIQFEYGGTYLDAGITLAEVVKMLMENGYSVGKLRNDRIEYKDGSDYFAEDYLYSNYAATEKKIA